MTGDYFPTLEEVRRLADMGNTIPISCEVTADLETPVSAYLKVARPPYSFLLESVEGGERVARHSFIGTEPSRVVITGAGQPEGAVDPLIPLKEVMDGFNLIPVPEIGPFSGGMVGYISYDAARHFEKLPSPENDPVGVPESVFMLTTTFLVFDHVRHAIRVVSHAYLGDGVEKGYRAATERIEEIMGRLDAPLQTPRCQVGAMPGDEAVSNMSHERYIENVRRCKEYIVRGDIIQTVPSQRFSRSTEAAPLDIYRALRAVNPSPYMYHLDLGDFHIVGASPEELVRVQDGVVTTRPIAGTKPRGASREEDDELERELLADEKERAEHIMLVDLGRNDIGRVCEPGTVEVTELMIVERYSHVMHIVSYVQGRLREDKTAYDALRACFPAGTLTGAPKIRAMEIIAELEPDKRGPYGGAVGYFDLNGNMDTAITIRTMVIKDGVAHAQAGGGIVHDSVSELEFQETIDKASASLRAIERAESGGLRR